MAHHTQPDDAFREIQLNGKQLVFLFMVATVVSVVIFLCGVFVGRGVRADRAPLAAETTAPATPVTTPDVAPPATPPPAGSDPTTAPPPPAVDELSYFDRLEARGSAPEKLKPASDKTAAAVAERQPPASAEKVAARAADRKEPLSTVGSPTPKSTGGAGDAPPAAATPDAPAASAVPAGQGFALQVTALKERNEAEAVAKRLAAKGYAAYVMTPANGTPRYYRVRIGKFSTRREAEDVATKLLREEQIKPWITR